MGKQKIEIAYKKYTSLNTWVTLIKQKLNYSQYIEQEQDTLSMSRTLSLLEKYAVIQIEFFNIYINVTNDIPPPPRFRIMFLFQAIYQYLRVFQSCW